MHNLYGCGLERRAPRRSQLHFPFPASTGPLEQDPVHGLHRATRTVFQNFCSVQISMINMAACGAVEALGAPRCRVDDAACRARLRRILSGNFDQGAPSLLQFVAQHICEGRPACTGDAARQRARLDHVGDLKFLNHHDPIRLGYRRAEAGEEVLALAPDLSVDAHHADFGFLSVLGSFLLAGDDALSARKAFQCLVIMLRVRRQVAIGVGQQVRDAAVDGEDRVLS